MAQPARTKGMHKQPATFDVTVQSVIGTVNVDGYGDRTPTEAAFLLIAQFGGDGEFSFPLGPLDEDGTCRVEVKHDVPARPADAF